MTIFERFRNEPSDINCHLDVLRDLAAECQTVIEFGTRLGCSAAAFIAGYPKMLTCYDLAKRPEVDAMLRKFADECCVSFEFISADDLNVEIAEVDMLFIDTLHMYEQLKKELAIHGNKAKKYLVFHDTHTFGHSGELDPNDLGLMPAIEEFIAENPSWGIYKIYTHNNGLTILKRK